MSEKEGFKDDDVCKYHYMFYNMLEEGSKQRGVLFKKMDSINAWVMGIAGGLIIALILLVINVILNLKNGK